MTSQNKESSWKYTFSNENSSTTGSSCRTPRQQCPPNRSETRTRICIQKSLQPLLKGLKQSLANWFTSSFAPSERKGDNRHLKICSQIETAAIERRTSVSLAASPCGPSRLEYWIIEPRADHGNVGPAQDPALPGRKQRVRVAVNAARLGATFEHDLGCRVFPAWMPDHLVRK